MSSHDPFPELQGFMASFDTGLREKVYGHLVPDSVRKLTAYLESHPDGPQLVTAMDDSKTPVEGSIMAPDTDDWFVPTAWATAWARTPAGGQRLCYMIWHDWYLDYLQYAFARHLMALKSRAADNTGRLALTQFRAEIARLAAAQAWF